MTRCRRQGWGLKAYCGSFIFLFLCMYFLLIYLFVLFYFLFLRGGGGNVTGFRVQGLRIFGLEGI